MCGRLIEADHLTRYHWAAQFARHRRVLDAGCGVAYGSVILAEAGAADVIGVDVASGVIEAVAEDMPPIVNLEPGDLRALRFGAAVFDLVVCFEVIEHVEDPTAVLDELSRVLAPDGLLVVSSPDRDASVGQNPHHLHELTRDELADLLAARFDNVEMFRQDGYLSSAIVPAGGGFDADSAKAATVLGLTAAEMDVASYVIAVASNAALPKPEPVIGVTIRLEFNHWQRVFDGAENRARAQERRIIELQEQVRDRAELQEQLLAAEQRLVSIPEFEETIRELKEASERHAGEVQVLDERIARADRVLRDVQSSPSWRITEPLRSLKNLLR